MERTARHVELTRPRAVTAIDHAGLASSGAERARFDQRPGGQADVLIAGLPQEPAHKRRINVRN